MTNIPKKVQAVIPRNPVELAQFLRDLCGADGYRMQNGLLLALRWDADGSEIVIDRFELAPAPAAAH
jgi:hypothetical protein